jgi:hypothetical protein
MSIVAMKKKYLESKNLSNNRRFSQYSSFNKPRTSVKSNSFLMNNKKKWKSVLPNQTQLDFFTSNTDYTNIDPTALRVIYNNWVQPVSNTGTDNSYESYIKSKEVRVLLCNNNIEPTTTTKTTITSSDCASCIVHKDLINDSSIYTSQKSNRLVKALECGTLGLNKPFPHYVSGKKLTYLSCGDKVVRQAYMALNYY